MSTQNRVLIAGGFTFSGGDAGGNYLIGLGKAIEGAGGCVQYLTVHAPGASIRADFQDFKCHTAPPGRPLKGWRSALVNLTASEHSVIEWLQRTTVSDFNTVLLHPGGDFTVAAVVKLQRLCRTKGWTLGVVVGEWQGFWQFGLLKLHHRILATLDSEIQRRIVYKKLDYVIAISSFLQRYYAGAGCKTVLVPPLVDVSNPKWDCRPRELNERHGVRLLFSGGWWRDRLDLITEAVLEVRAQGQDVVLEFAGPKRDDLLRDPRLKKQVMRAPEGAFRFHGKVPVEKVLPISAAVDFGVLLRDRAKWSDACFPSKVAEFQALGVPMLCNLSSNLDDILRDGENALIVPEASVASFVATLRRALALSPAQRRHLSEGSLRCAATRLDPRVYSDALRQFFQWPSSRGITAGPVPAGCPVRT